MKRMLLVALAVVALALVASVAVAQVPTTVEPRQTSVTLAVGQEIDVPIMVSNAYDWYGVDLRMVFDPAVVQVVSVTRGAIPQPDFVVWEQYDNVAGAAYYVATQLNPTLPANGSGLIATIRLRGVSGGNAPLIFTVQAANRNGVLVFGEVITGQPAPPAVTLIPTSTSVPIIPTAVLSSTCHLVRGHLICVAQVQ